MTIKSIKSANKFSKASALPEYSLPVRTNLDFWYDASTGVQRTNNLVSQWDDLSGNNKHATQSGSGEQPTYIANGLNGRPVLRFDGFNDHMLIPTTAFRNNTNHSIFYVHTYGGDAQSSDAYDAAFGIWTTGADRGSLHYIKDDGLRYSGATYPYYPGGASYDTTTSYYIPGNTYLMEFHFNGATWEVVKNGVREASVAGTNPYTDLNGFKLARQDQPLRFRKGDFAEILGYSVGLSESSRAAVREYLTKKWGIDTGGLGKSERNPARDATELFDSGQRLSGFYWLIGNGSTPYKIYCDFDNFGGKWMLAWQFPRDIDRFTSNNFTESRNVLNAYNDQAFIDSKNYQIPISIFTKNGTGTDLDIYSQVYRTGQWRRMGAFWRGIPMNTHWSTTLPGGQSTGLTTQVSGDGITWVAGPNALNYSDQWDGPHYSTGGGTYSYADTTFNTSGLIWHSTALNGPIGRIYGNVEGQGVVLDSADWSYGRIWIRVQ